MTSQERVELGDLRKEMQEGFKEIRGLHMDMLQRLARLEQAASTTQATTQYKLMQIGVAISLIGCLWNITH